MCVFVRPNCLQLEHQNYSSCGMLETCENRKRENEKKKHHWGKTIKIKVTAEFGSDPNSSSTIRRQDDLLCYKVSQLRH